MQSVQNKDPSSEDVLYSAHNFVQIADEVGHTEILNVLLYSNKTSTGEHNNIREPTLLKAVENSDTDCIKVLLQEDASTEIRLPAHNNVFHIAARLGHFELLKTLLYRDKIFTSQNINAKNVNGETALFKAIENGHTECVRVLLQEGPSIQISLPEHDNVLHVAANLGHVEILKILLYHDKMSARQQINAKNDIGETAIFKAIQNGHTDCVKALLQEGAIIETILPQDYNVFHIAAKLGHVEILKVLLDHDETFTENQINSLTSDDNGFAPIHFALDNNNTECVHLLLSKNVPMNLKTSSGLTLLHIGAKRNNLEFVKLFLKSEPSSIHAVDNILGWSPLHYACLYRAKEAVRILIVEGGNSLASTKDEITGIEMMMNNLSKPTEFLKSILDEHVVLTKENSGDPYVILRYEILIKNSYSDEAEDNKEKISGFQMEVIDALLSTGNCSDQKRLLIHPLVESFICLKWKVLIPFVYIMVLIHSLFVMTLTIFIMTDFEYKDKGLEKPIIWDSTFWTCALYCITVIALLQEVIFLVACSKRYFLQIETLLKLVSLILAMILPTLNEEPNSPSLDTVTWMRHIATIAILLCWLNITFLLSKFSGLGRYVLICSKIFSNMGKILVTFFCLVVGFTLSFMIQFRHQNCFENFWVAFIKTMVMMTSEFDYDDMVSGQNYLSLTMIRIIFLIFLIVAPIVLMNLMVGVAVSDLNDLEICGHIMQLEKQVEIIYNIGIVYKKLIKRLPSDLVLEVDRFLDKIDKGGYLKNLDNVILNFNPHEQILVFTDETNYKHSPSVIPAHVREAIFKTAVEQQKKTEHSTNQTIDSIILENMKKQLDEILSKQSGCQHVNEQLVQIQDYQLIFKNVKKQLDEIRDHRVVIESRKKHLDDLNKKIDLMMTMLIQLKPSLQSRKRRDTT